MIKQDRNIFTTFAIVLLVLTATGVATGCASKTCRSGDNSRFRCDPTAAATDILSWTSFAEAGSVDREIESIWRSRNQFVHLEFQDYVTGGPPVPNSHPVQILRERIRGALQVIVVQESPKIDPMPLFTEGSLELLGRYLEEGLAEARPNQDVTFAVEQWYQGPLGTAEPKVITGRVFYADHWLNLILGSILRDGTTQRASTLDDPRRNAYVPGLRSLSVEHTSRILVLPDSGVYKPRGSNRNDWLLFSPQALVARVPATSRLE